MGDLSDRVNDTTRAAMSDPLFAVKYTLKGMVKRRAGEADTLRNQVRQTIARLEAAGEPNSVMLDGLRAAEAIAAASCDLYGWAFDPLYRNVAVEYLSRADEKLRRAEATAAAVCGLEYP